MCPETQGEEKAVVSTMQAMISVLTEVHLTQKIAISECMVVQSVVIEVKIWLTMFKMKKEVPLKCTVVQ